MDRKIFVGDKVSTPWGEGYVRDARSWREVIDDMDDYEALEFSERCRVEVGPDYKEKWVEIFVEVQGLRRKMLGSQVEVLEGRDGSW